MKKQAGFTLIELIMVIVILGILSAFALPRFADLSDSAETASLEGALASLKSSSSIVHASALANTQTGATGEISMEGDFFALVEGYPDAGGVNNDDGTTTDGFGIAEAAGVASDYTITYRVAGAGEVDSATVLVTIAAPADGDECVVYQEAAAGGVPTIIKSTITVVAGAANDTCGTVVYE